MKWIKRHCKARDCIIKRLTLLTLDLTRLGEKKYTQPKLKDHLHMIEVIFLETLGKKGRAAQTLSMITAVHH